MDSAEFEQKKSDGPDSIDPAMLMLLVCPLTKQNLHHDVERGELVSRAANLAYPIRGGVAIMLPSEARVLDEEH